MQKQSTWVADISANTQNFNEEYTYYQQSFRAVGNMPQQRRRSQFNKALERFISRFFIFSCLPRQHIIARNDVTRAPSRSHVIVTDARRIYVPPLSSFFEFNSNFMFLNFFSMIAASAISSTSGKIKKI